MTEMMSGTENGIEYKVYLSAPNWICEVKKGDKIISSSWRWFAEPRYGVDVDDIAKAEKELDRLINEMKEVKQT
jgi:hypothetical protein